MLVYKAIRMKNYLLILGCVLAVIASLSAQNANYVTMFLDRQDDLMVKSVYLSGSPSARVHTGIRPYRYDMFDKMQWDSLDFQWENGIFRKMPMSVKKDSTQAYLPEYIGYKGGGKFGKWIHDKVFNESLITLGSKLGDKNENFSLSINPIFNLELGPGPDRMRYLNGRGVWITGNINKRFSFYTMIGENQGYFPALYNDYYKDTGFVMGWGYRKDFNSGGHDFAMAMGEINFTPNNNFSFTLGHGKNFFGEGVRSLFLSDNAMAYPFFKIETTIGSIKYVNLWSIMNDAYRVSSEDLYPNKYTSMHLLSWNVTPRWNVQFFESNIWGADSTGKGGFNANFFNPVIFYRTVELQAGFIGGNALIGVGSSYRIAQGVNVYGQFVLDDFKLSSFKERKEGHWLNLYGYQLGLEIAGKGNRMNYLSGVEFNRVNPFVYSHRSTGTNYAHLNYPLAHPWGAGFQEVLVHGQMRYKRYFAELQVSIGTAGRDTSGINLGNNIFNSYNERPLGSYGYFFPTGEKSNIFSGQIAIGYILNISTGMRFEVGYRYRKEESSLYLNEMNWFFIGIKTPFMNKNLNF